MKSEDSSLLVKRKTYVWFRFITYFRQSLIKTEFSLSPTPD